MNINEPSEGLDVNTEYATQWIEYLKKKNTVLTFVWPVLLCTTIAFSITSLYFFQQMSATTIALDASKETNTAIQGELELNNQKNEMLSAKIKELNDTKNTLEQQKGDSASQLGLSGQMVDALTEKNEALEIENALITTALTQSKILLEKNNKRNQSTEKTLETKIKAHNKERFILEKKYRDGQVAFKALMSRQKEMRQEMNRLADLVDDQKNEIKMLVLAKNKTQAALNAANIKNSELEAKYKSLDESLRLAVEPISKPENKKNQTIDTLESDGLEEIRAPIKEASPKNQESKTSETYDFDQISIDH